MQVIALSGWKQSGKDTLAAYLVEKHGFIRTSFADSLKDLVASEYDIPRTWLDDPNFKERPLFHLPVKPQDKFTSMIAQFMGKEFRCENGKIPEGFDLNSNQGIFKNSTSIYNQDVYHTPRSLAILKGSTNRLVSSDFWVQKAIKKIKASNNDFHVIPDLRYKSEANQLLQAFGKNVDFVRVNRFNTSPSNDPSERDLDQYLFDYYIDNKDSLNYTHAQLENVLSVIKNKKAPVDFSTEAL